MVHFIESQDKSENVETIMEYVNDYINYGRINLIANENHYCINQEYDLLQKLAVSVNQGYKISPENYIENLTGFSKIKIVIKKIIRKCIKWYIKDIALQQTEFNANVARWINQEMRTIQKIDAEITRLRNSRNFVSESVPELPENWYVDFENEFRGSSAEIKERLKIYLPWFKNKTNVIDLGCGRGEFLELMKENSIPAFGIDINRSMVEECRKKGLNVKQQDCVAALKSQKKESLDGIFASQLVEHLSKEELYTLIEISKEKLTKGGVLILETVNPLTLGIFCYGFYIDPTHTVPVHPAMLRFMAERAGFEVEPVGFLNAFSNEYKFPEENSMTHGEKVIVQKLNEQLYGAQDYYLVCRKG